MGLQKEGIGGLSLGVTNYSAIRPARPRQAAGSGYQPARPSSGLIELMGLVYTVGWRAINVLAVSRRQFRGITVPGNMLVGFVDWLECWAGRMRVC